MPSPEEEERQWPCQHAAGEDAAVTATAAGAPENAGGVKKTVILKLDPNTMRATTDGGGRVTMTLIDAKNYNAGSVGGANGIIINNNNNGGSDNASAPPTNHLNAGVHTGVTGAFTANGVTNPALSTTSVTPTSGSGHSVRYSGVTRVMVYSPEQCSAHVGHVCSKHKTVTIPLDSIEAMRRAEIMWPIMR